MIRLSAEVLVVDASALLEVLLRTPAAQAIERRLFGERVVLNAPELIDLEVVQVMRRYVLRGFMTAERALEAIDLLPAFPIRRHGHLPLLTRVWNLYENVTAYDAAYVALAEGLNATLVTRDQRLAGSSGHRATIELL